MRTIPRQSNDRTKIKFRGKVRKAVAVTGIAIVILLSNPGPVAAAAPLNNVKLTWSRSPSSDVVGYRIYYGIASGSYTNSIVLGDVTNFTLSNLVNGVTYFFASKGYTASGIESPYSNEALLVPGGGATLRLTMAANQQSILTLTGLAGHTYEIQSSTTLTSWNVIGSVPVGVSSTATYTDTSAPSYSRRYYRTRDTTP